METTTNKIFIVINDFDNSEVEESTMYDYVERYGKEGHDMSFSCTIKIIKKTNSSEFIVKKFKNGDTYSNGTNVIDDGVVYSTEQKAQNALNDFYKEYAKNNESAPAYFDNEAEALEALEELKEIY